MAKGPKELLEIRPDDTEAVQQLENFIDSSQVLKDYDGKEITVLIPKDLWNKNFSTRPSQRRQLLVQLYKKAGWGQIYINAPGEGKNYDHNASIRLNQWEASG